MSDEASKLKGLAWAVGALLIGASFAVGLSPLVRAIPWKWETGLASLIPVPPDKACPGNGQSNALLTRLVARLYPVEPDDGKISITVRIAKDHAINAYAGLGGTIFVNEGLLEKASSAEEVAGVLAHEIEHVKRRHIFENILIRLVTIGGLQMIFNGAHASDAKWINYFLNMHFSRAQESEADEGGLKRLQMAHIDNQGFRDFFKRMEDESAAPGFLSDHPDNQERYEMADKFKNDNPKPIMTQEEWLRFKHYCHE